MYDPNDIFMGESLRGLQDTHVGNYEIGAAQRQLAALRGQLGQLAQSQAAARFAGHAPAQQHVRPAYKDSTQIAIKCSGIFVPANWTGTTSLPEISGQTRIMESFKPMKPMLTESLLFTFTNDSLGTKTVPVYVSDSADLLLTSAFIGAKNCFPIAPNQDSAIPGPAFASNALGNGISWPTANPGIDASVRIAIDETVLGQVTPPTNYTIDDLVSVKVTARFTLWGPSLRP